MDIVLLNLLPTIGVGGVFIMVLFFALNRGTLLTKGQHTSILEAEKRRGNDLKDTLLEEKSIKKEVLRQNGVLINDQRIVYDFFREVTVRHPAIAAESLPTLQYNGSEDSTRPKEAV